MSIEVDLDVFASLSEKLDREHKWRDKIQGAIYQHTFDPLQVPLVAGSGTLDLPGQMSPPRGFMWGVRRLTLSGYTAGNATAYLNNLEPIPFSQAGMSTFGRGEMVLGSGDRLTVQATGITGIVQLNGVADCFETWYLPYYIG